MKIFIISFVILLSMQTCSQSSNNDFVNKITNDFSRNSYFIVLNVSLPEGVIASLIENDDLYYYFYKTKGYNESKYKEEAGMIISKMITVAKADFSRFGFIRIENIPRLNEEAKRGKDFIVSKYFKNNVIVDGVMENERNVLVKLLFDWDIPSRIDDETGYLIIESK